MKKGQVLILAAILSIGALTSCKKKGCTDVNANNYNESAKKDDGSCTYPVINMNPSGNSGDISGGGGTATNSQVFSQTNATLGWDMSINASTGSFNLTVRDADGIVVIDKTLTAGVGAQDAAGTSLSGTPGNWTATITLTNFTGTGDYSFQ